MREALDDLIAAVESGTFLCNDALSPRANENVAYRAFSGSLDAALALHKALLPGWSVTLENDEGSIHAAVWPRGEIGEQHGAEGPTLAPARAWLLAILRAYRQQRGSEE